MGFKLPFDLDIIKQEDVMQNLELTILDFIQNHMRSEIGDILAPFISSLGNWGMIWIVLTVVLLLSKKHRKAGIYLALSLLFDLLLCNLCLKPLFARGRPFSVNESVQLLVKAPLDYSFPSGHTAASFASAAALFLAREKYWYIALILAVMIAFSRLYLYVHYPTDVLGGIVVGLLSAWLAGKLIAGLRKKRFT